MESLSHKELVELAATWLKRNHAVVVTELATVGEEPDAIGFSANGWTTLIECKTSHADFVNDNKKPWRRRAEMGIGDMRYYFCQSGLINVSELPPSWGLLEVKGKRIFCSQKAMPIKESNKRHEIGILVSLLRRVGHNCPAPVSVRLYKYETKNNASLGIEEIGEK
jgi:hypothetical protein